MKHTARFAVLAALLFAGGTVFAAETKDKAGKHTITLKSGKVLQDAVVLDKKPNGVTFGYKEGAAFVPYTDMPEGAQWGNVRAWQLPGGYKQFSFELPLEMLGKPEVWIRFIPTRNASGSAQSYDEAEISNNHVCMNYLAIRYAK